MVGVVPKDTSKSFFFLKKKKGLLDFVVDQIMPTQRY